MPRSVVRHAFALLVITGIGACGDGADIAGPSAAQGRWKDARGAVLAAAKTATGFHELRTEYDWTVRKRVHSIMDEHMLPLPSTTTAHLSRGETVWIEYEIETTRTPLAPRLVAGVRGSVCVTNSGGRATENLQVVDVVLAPTGAGGYTEVARAPVDLSSQPVLQAGETACYPYETLFAALPGGSYRNAVEVTITNDAEHPGQPFGPGADGAPVEVDFAVPATATNATVDATAILDDGMRADSAARWWERGPCAEHFMLFQCTSGNDRGIWQLTSGQHVVFIVDFYNRMACDETIRLHNVATLTESGLPGRPPQARVDTATIVITTDPCPPAPGCTLTQGYWKQPHHPWPGSTEWERSFLRRWPFFDSGRSWQQTLDAPPAGGNAYLILAHQYIAATLNLGNGADAPAAVRETRAAAALYFSLLPADRERHDRATLIAWADLLARFNEGNAGVPHCN